MLALEKNIPLLFLPEIKPATFQSWVWCSTTEWFRLPNLYITFCLCFQRWFELFILCVLSAGSPNKTIHLQFRTMSTECSFDFLFIYDGKSYSSPLLATLSGDSMPHPVTARSGYVSKVTSLGGIKFWLAWKVWAAANAVIFSKTVPAKPIQHWSVSVLFFEVGCFRLWLVIACIYRAVCVFASSGDFRCQF